MQETPAKTRKAAMIAAAGRWLQVSRYDRASSLLLTLLCTIGLVAALLFVVWLTGKITAPPQVALSPRIITIAKGDDGGNGQAPGGTQLDAPSPDEPAIGQAKETSGVRSEPIAIDVAATSKAPKIDDPEALTVARQGDRGTKGGKNGGDGPGSGDGDRDGKPGVSRHWEVLFSKNTLDAYAKQLDWFHIELGIILPGNKIICAKNLAHSKPDTYIVENAAVNEKRYYLTWRNGEMQQADRELLARAGVEVEDRLILKFLPRETEAKLVELERSYAGTNAKRIGRTRFGVQPEGGGFRFFVLEQTVKR